MTQIKLIGIDTSKAVFTLHGVDQAGLAVLRVNLRRAQMIPFFKKLPPTEIALEACASSHHWARLLAALGHTVRLIPPQYVRLSWRWLLVSAIADSCDARRLPWTWRSLTAG